MRVTLLVRDIPIPHYAGADLLAASWKEIGITVAQDRRNIWDDALFVAQAMTTDPRQRAKMVRDFERHALTEAYTVPLLWWNRIVATSSKLRRWSITPSHFLGQDLTEVWIDR